MGSPILTWRRTVPHVVEIPFAFYTVLWSLVTPGDLSSGYVFIPSWTSLVRIRPLLAMIVDKEVGTPTMACVFVVALSAGELRWSGRTRPVQMSPAPVPPDNI